MTVGIEPGGSINIASGQYLQISGPFSADLYQVFYGAGSVYFYGGVSSTKEVYPQWFGAMGNAKSSGFTAGAGNTTITLGSYVGSGPWVAGDPITLMGAGPSGANLTTSVVSVNSGNTSLVVLVAPSTSVSALSPAYNVDDSAALNKWASSIRGSAYTGQFSGSVAAYQMTSSLGPSVLYVPKGTYNVCSLPVVSTLGLLLHLKLRIQLILPFSLFAISPSQEYR